MYVRYSSGVNNESGTDDNDDTGTGTDTETDQDDHDENEVEDEDEEEADENDDEDAGDDESIVVIPTPDDVEIFEGKAWQDAVPRGHYLRLILDPSCMEILNGLC